LPSAASALIIVENESVPWDTRVWREAQTLIQDGWHVSVICPMNPHDDRLANSRSNGGAFEVLDDVSIYRFPVTFANEGVGAYLREYLTASFQIAKLSWQVYRRQGFDVIQVCNPPDLFAPLMAFYRLLGKATIYDHHDLFPESIGHRFPSLPGRIAKGIALAAEWLTYKCADVVISTNESYKEIAARRGGVKPSRSFVVRNGPAIDDFQPVPADLALKGGFAFLASYVGVMGAEDGIDVMLDAINHVIHNLGRNDVRFVIVGNGPMRLWAQNRVRELGLESQVTFTGRIPAAELRAYLSTADICLSPDPYTPLNDLSTMTKVVEYMMLGKALVSFELKEARFSAGESAVYVPSGDVAAYAQAISDLLDDPERRRRMGELGRARATSTLAWDHQRPQLLAAYRASVSRRGLAVKPVERFAGS
jgi:glycosyltransferase involved in cell wall biosynthesis